MYRGTRTGVTVNPSRPGLVGVPSAPPVELVDLSGRFSQRSTHLAWLELGPVRPLKALVGPLPRVVQDQYLTIAMFARPRSSPNR